MAKQTKFGVNYNQITRQGTSPYETRLYAGASPLTHRIPVVRCYGTNDPMTSAFGSGSQSKNIFDSGYIPWYADDNPGTWRSTANGANDTKFTQLFQRMCALDFGGTVNGSISGSSFGGTKPTFVMFTPQHEADLGPTQGTNADYRAMWTQVRSLLNAVLADTTHNPGGHQRILLTTCPTGTGVHFGTNGWQPTSASEVDICGYDKYFPSVGPHLDPNAAPPYVDGTGGAIFGGHHLEWLRQECDDNYGADMPMALGEIGISISATTANGGKGLDPNRNNTNSLRYKWFKDSTHGLIDYFKNTRLPSGDPKWFAACYFIIGFGNNPNPPSELAQGFESGIPWSAFRDAQNALVDTGTTISAPTPGATTGVTASGATLHWTNPSGTTGTQVYQDGALIHTTAAAATSYAVTGLASGTTYTFTLKAVAADGTTSVASADIPVTTVPTADTTPPTVPGNLRLTGTPTTAGYGVAWDASTDRAPSGVTPSGMGGYRFYVDGVKRGNDIPTTQLSRGVTVVTPDTTYHVKVTAFDLAGNENPLSSVTALTVVIPPVTNTPPTVPTGVTEMTGLTTVGAYGATWVASSDDVEVLGYQVRVDGVEKPVGGTAVTWQGTGPAGATHTFEVQAVDNTGLKSGYSAPITLTGVAGNNPTPVLVLTPGQTGEAPFSVTADLSGSTDPNGDALSYTYKWGDGSADLVDVTDSVKAHTYADAGAYNAEFGVRDTTNLYSPVRKTITVSPAGGGTPNYGFPYFVKGSLITADDMNTVLDLIDGAVFLAAGGGGGLVTRWDAEAILVSGALPATATNLLPPGIEVPYDTTIATIAYAVGTAGSGAGGTVLRCRYVDPDGNAAVIPGSGVTIASGTTQGSVGGLGFPVQAGGNLLFDLTGGSATPAADLRVHVFGV